MNKPTNHETKPRSLNFEINPQLFWTIFTAIIGVSFYLGFNFGERKSTKEISEKDKQITTIARDTQNVYNRLTGNLHIRITFLDTETDSKRVSEVRSRFEGFNFIETNRFAVIDESSLIVKDIPSKPAILVAHWHAYRTEGKNAHDEPSETLLIKTIKQYADANPAIKIIVFSTTFGDPNEKERFFRIVSPKLPNLKEGINIYPLHPGNKDEVSTIAAKILSISIEQVQKITKQL